jgi:hypothetical protein
MCGYAYLRCQRRQHNTQPKPCNCTDPRRLIPPSVPNPADQRTAWQRPEREHKPSPSVRSRTRLFSRTRSAPPLMTPASERQQLATQSALATSASAWHFIKRSLRGGPPSLSLSFPRAAPSEIPSPRLDAPRPPQLPNGRSVDSYTAAVLRAHRTPASCYKKLPTPPPFATPLQSHSSFPS